jgi:hypothetical protein
VVLIAKYAEHFGLNNGEYFWMMGGEVDLIEVAQWASTNANVSKKLVNGMASIRWLDGFDIEPEEDLFLQEWKRQNATFAELVNNVQHPVKSTTSPGYFHGDDDYFQIHLPQQRGAGFLYDAVMSVALGKCQQEASPAPNSQRPPHRRELLESIEIDARQERALQSPGTPGNRAPSNPHMVAIANTTFHGATGRVRYNRAVFPTRFGKTYPANRDMTSLTYGIYNFCTAGNGEDDR